jgi:hypothetical protein
MLAMPMSSSADDEHPLDPANISSPEATSNTFLTLDVDMPNNDAEFRAAGLISQGIKRPNWP